MNQLRECQARWQGLVGTDKKEVQVDTVLQLRGEACTTIKLVHEVGWINSYAALV